MQKIQKRLIDVILLFIFLFCSLHVFTQNKILDSLKKLLPTQKKDTNKVNILNAFAREYNNENDSKSYAIYQPGIPAFRKINFKSGVGSAYFNIAWIYENVKDYTKSLKNHFYAVQIRRETGDNFRLAIW